LLQLFCRAVKKKGTCQEKKKMTAIETPTTTTPRKGMPPPAASAPRGFLHFLRGKARGDRRMSLVKSPSLVAKLSSPPSPQSITGTALACQRRLLVLLDFHESFLWPATSTGLIDRFTLSHAFAVRSGLSFFRSLGF
jgi:hypothetical protein